MAITGKGPFRRRKNWYKLDKIPSFTENKLSEGSPYLYDKLIVTFGFYMNLCF